jgi:hypothetical protein
MTASANTRPVRISGMTHGTAYRANRQAATDAIADARPWQGSNNMSGEPHTPGEPLPVGKLDNPAEAAEVQGADYVIRSYATPIAWHSPNRPDGVAWTYTAERYSVTTTKHAGLAHAITGYGAVTPRR